MLFCKKCKVSVNCETNVCPLCQGDLVGEKSQNSVFPIVSKQKHLVNLILKIAALVTISLTAICVLFNLKFGGGSWSLYVVAGLITAWSIIIITMKMHGNIAKNTIWLTAIISIASVLWDLWTDFHGWSIDYIIPIICCFAMIFMAIVAIVKNLRIQEYLVYLIIDIIFGLIPFILLIIDAVKVVYPSMVCVAGSIISLTFLSLFEGKTLKEEIKRRIHI
ncbi:hypothetical protein JYG23_11860 [Sedimentibacter sp. zth1]|uniref:DUF6320 domain-containing protein n=1 Tax=Sedimentibacter sp. zth1 TaxID=2816908 RepID=UPI001A938D73|nr:DUF6320 domain-containing protein [Sedimentibacter sp. zth1]QSX05365.1 hypothetical protein JYG23_11860 [Sedimentibacter sp. zth1]